MPRGVIQNYAMPFSSVIGPGLCAPLKASDTGPISCLEKGRVVLNYTRAKLLLQEFPELKRRYWGGHFWGIGYGAGSVGNITDELLEAYLNHHKDQPNGEENFILE